jgi:methyl-CpG-binding domain protein 4
MQTLIIPASPFLMLQEIYRDDPWKIMVCCMLLNQTSRQQVYRVKDQLFSKYPSAEKLSKARVKTISNIIQTLGLHNRRAYNLIKMSQNFSAKE